MDCNNFLNDEDILKDQNRIQPFLNAITRNKHLFKDKVILDLNAGLGLIPVILSRSGAKQVFAMKSHDHAQKIIEQNNVNNVTLHKKSIKEVELECKVDIIISAWMGNLLFYRGNIQELIAARDKYLNKDGLILPDKGQLLLQSIEDGEYREQKLTFWDSVYGVNMKWMKRWVKHEPLLESIRQDQLNSDPVLIYEVDLMKCTLEDLSFSNSYQVQINRQDFVTGVIIWMKYSFTFTHLPIDVIMGPSKSPFWKPVILYFNEEIPASKGDKLKGSLAMKFISEDLIDLKLSVHTKQYHQIQYFRLN
ncbi:unnamed protein product (macronuclear) [Paramecium tetraurelia]|uniref:Protein arginine N-methyltransferase domain-containing protein n=1 Tax=Paramecium tetraurelia TaxID=5888 RepID=A0E0U5_PARTE|nr:uncharacterized protein GSPATT00022080001 [Paramecium tetraurelia]CAK88912.1 unnamed protein product [Paramecium tetraurelia]|eukprot:XP_001456309.1 hypothetical protein (macronuclear) [Paramecium tetraurelia strain d4-2]